ncbi:hypothetical protein HPB50_009538 [Hyalomma asiaticum]|uniref:Uncharacterized protein n=1 Tax=Hyalomma asiaticum TaxID=266040 RepID=A0ACB7RK35_HYAAI|nr:hypothetical protein HPB50_009538 [Hyalomma asiaticum]
MKKGDAFHRSTSCSLTTQDVRSPVPVFSSACTARYSPSRRLETVATCLQPRRRLEPTRGGLGTLPLPRPSKTSSDCLLCDIDLTCLLQGPKVAFTGRTAASGHAEDPAGHVFNKKGPFMWDENDLSSQRSQMGLIGVQLSVLDGCSRPESCSHRLCSVCSVVPDVAFRLGCRHVFCTACMNDLMRNSPAVVCPFDDNEFANVNVNWDSASEGYVSSCKTYCLNRAFGCPYVGRMSEMIEHYYRECDYHVVYCGCCAKPVARVNVLAHLREGCSIGILTLDNTLVSAAARVFGAETDESLSAACKDIVTFVKRTVNLDENSTDVTADGNDMDHVGSVAASSSPVGEVLEECNVGTLTSNNPLASATARIFGAEADECLSAARKNIENFMNRTKATPNQVENRTECSNDVPDIQRVGSQAATSSHIDKTADAMMQCGQMKINVKAVSSLNSEDVLAHPGDSTSRLRVNGVLFAAESCSQQRLGTKTNSTQTDLTEWPCSEQVVDCENSEDSITPLFNDVAACASWAPDSAYHSSASESEATDFNRELADLKRKSISVVAEAKPEPIRQPLVAYDWDVRPFRKYRNPPWPEFKSDVLTVGERGYRLRLEGKFKFLNFPSRFLALYVRILKGPDDASLEWPFRRKCSFLLMHTRYAERDILFELEDHVNADRLPRATRLRLERPKTAENFAIGIDQFVSVQQMVEGGFVYKNTFRIRFVVE